MRILYYTLLITLLAGCSTVSTVESGPSPAGILFDMQKTRSPLTGDVPSHLVHQVNKGVLGATMQNKAQRVYPNTWMPVDDRFANLAVTQVVYDPGNTNFFYFCTGEGFFNADGARGAGVWKSSDAGETWNQLSTTLSDTFWYCQDMAVHPSGDVYVATRIGGLMRSQDGGATWTQVLGAGNGALHSQAADIEINSDGDVVVSFGLINSTDGIYISTTGDAGSWQKIMNGLPTSNYGRIEFATAPSNPDVMYCVPCRISDRRVHGVYKTTDRGQTWDTVGKPGGDLNFAARQGWYDLIVEIDPNNPDIVAVGGLNVFRTMDGGTSWQQLFEGRRNRNTPLQYVHVDQHNIVFQDSDTVYFTNDGGIWKTDNFRADTPLIYSVNLNYNTTQFYSCDISPEETTSTLLGGTQDNGSQASNGEGVSEYSQVSWADGSFCAIDQENGAYQYTTTQYSRMYRTYNGVQTTITNPYILDGENGNTLFINPIHMDVNDPTILYQATNSGLWALFNARTADRTEWKQISNRFGTISAIGTSRAVENSVFVGRVNLPYRVDNKLTGDGANFAQRLDRNNEVPPSGGYLNCIVPDDRDSNHVILVYTNFDVNSVYETFNAFDYDPDWRSCEGNLPNIPVRWGCFKNGSSEVFYVATELGVYVTDKLDGDQTVWRSTSDKFPNIRVDMIKSRVSDNLFVAATHGRGMFTGYADENNDINWVERGPTNVGGRTRTLLIDPNDPSHQKVWAGSVSGGLWVVNDIDSSAYYYEVNTSESLVVYPNPTHELNFITIDGKTDDLVVEVFNNLGQLVIKRRFAYDGLEPVTLNGLADGIIYVRLTQGDVKVVKKVIKTSL